MTPFAAGWSRLLQEIELARHYPHPYMLSANGGGARNPILEQILPGLLYIKAASLLDEALVQYLDDNGLRLTKPYQHSLGGRIRFLTDRRAFQDGGAVLAIATKRNQLAHEVDAKVTWDELDSAVSTAQREMERLSLVGARPDYEFFAERSAMRETQKEGALTECTYTYGLRRGGKLVVTISYTEYLMKD